ncbi:beta-galactosidase [Paenibacillus sp. WQ 127069]|uniref:Beta-galactosidase n=1 Tax=Paenibacillus baimaensis TaxID=2982185 RepID=A0ABT2UQC6_9BACL|nr:beta-galactosidase [Paenibacillus sp. WQ 127069]MCU6796226.1 beta-galactosidase [Paenibacillus sp. WQ 127069]
MISNKLNKIAYGGDYSPEQWPQEIMTEDMRMFKLAGIDIATVAVFSWSLMQPDEETYQFEWLDEIMDKLYENGVYACLATSTGAHPAWMAHRHPDVLRVDFEGRKHTFGQRHNSCPNSPTYRLYAARLARKLAERYKDHPALAVWHVNNEYGGICYCDNCAKAFRVWLQQRYGSLDQLNKAWNTRFWGHTFYDWDEIVPPNLLSEHSAETRTTFQGISLDYQRFNSDGLLDCYLLEYNELKTVTPDVPVTTNMMWMFKQLDYAKWAKHVDVVSWDSYPSNTTPLSHVAMWHDVMRGLKDGQPFMLMEQTPSQQNWQAYNGLKRPGVMRLWSYQAVAHGADTVMFFQLRRSVGACEKYHGAVIEHVGHEHTRVFRECATLGGELQVLGDKLLGSRIEARVAIIIDWENWWAMEFSSGPTIDLSYMTELAKYYVAFYDQNIAVDMISVEADFSRYDVVIAPVLYMVKPGVADKLERYVEAGGRFVTTFFSGIVNESDLVTLGGYPGELRKLLGIWVEEIDALFPHMSNRIVMTEGREGFKKEYSSTLLCDILHTEGAEVWAEYGEEFYKGTPVLTRNSFGQGEAWYVASSPDKSFLADFATLLVKQAGIESVLAAPEGIEATRRVKDGQAYTMILNHNDSETEVNLGSNQRSELLGGQAVSGAVKIPAKGVWILEEASQ